MPTGAVYILVATLVAPALIQMKIAPWPLIFFFSFTGYCRDHATCSGCGIRAAALGGADPMRTGYAAMRFGWMAFVIPFLFVFSGPAPAGNFFYIIIDVVTAIGGIWLVSAAVIGYTTRIIGILYRTLCALAGLALLIPMGFFSEPAT